MLGETILNVDDEKLIRWSLREELSKDGFNILEADTIKRCYAVLREHDPDLMILDQLLPDGTGIDVLYHVQTGKNILPVIMLTAIDRSDVAVQAMKLGVFDYVTKPVNMEELRIVIGKALEATRLRRQVAHFLKEQEKTFGFCGMIGSSPPMKKVFHDITKIAQSGGTTVLITGESGTGKELAAKALHFLSERREKPLMMVNISALPETLIESELFGHEKGAFTDAKTQKKGIFELADGGTIFLDEIGDISPKVQVKLLRVVEQKTFQRIGGVSDITVDVRIIAATNQSLEERICQGSFRADLYYRLNVANIHMPPLRERGDDILMLAEYFVQEFNMTFHKRFKDLTGETKQMFLTYQWPGNIRELKNVLERAILLGDGELVSPKDIEFSDIHKPQMSTSPRDMEIGQNSYSLYDLEKQALRRALEQAGYNQSKAARLLRISRDTLRYRMKKYGLNQHCD
ncbi:MAG: sigma-54-dependent Fis family transcriptional regulator [Ignavibacteriae bacterium]|nr:sigma-54-dependent Fis family transcriptional regulator [Ignavibacteriota bacterium]